MGLRLPQALVDVINRVLAADEPVEILLHQRLQLACLLADPNLEVLAAPYQLRQCSALQVALKLMSMHIFPLCVHLPMWHAACLYFFE